MPKQVFNPPGFAPPIGPYSWATHHGNLIFLAGTAARWSGRQAGRRGRHPQTDAGDAREPEERLSSPLAAPSQDIVKTTVYLGDVKDYGGMNEVYRT